MLCINRKRLYNDTQRARGAAGAQWGKLSRRAISPIIYIRHFISHIHPFVGRYVMFYNAFSNIPQFRNPSEIKFNVIFLSEIIEIAPH